MALSVLFHAMLLRESEVLVPTDQGGPAVLNYSFNQARNFSWLGWMSLTNAPLYFSQVW